MFVIKVSIPNLMIALPCSVSIVTNPQFPEIENEVTSRDSDHPLEGTYITHLLWSTYVQNLKCLCSPLQEIGRS